MYCIEKSIDVGVPVRTAYNQWTQSEEFPRFMDGIESVDQLDSRRLRWKAKIGGKSVEWDAEIYEQVPDRTIAWRSVSGAKNEGVVRFEPRGDTRTRISLKLDYEPKGLAENAGDAMGVLSRKVEQDLERFQEYIEARGVETGAWRGEIHEESASRPSPSR
jgi:uncharacterized membrane protein